MYKSEREKHKQPQINKQKYFFFFWYEKKKNQTHVI